MAQNITSTGNISINGNAIINGDSSKSTLINGSLTCNNNSNINGNLTVTGTTNLNSLNISDVLNANGTIKLNNDVYFQATPNQYLGAFYDLKIYANTQFLFYLNNVLKFSIDQNQIYVPNNISCNILYASQSNIESLLSGNITNNDTINTKFLQLKANIYLNATNSDTMELRSISNITMYINNVQKFLLNSQYLYTPKIQFYDPTININGNSNSLILNSNNNIIFNSNSIEKMKVDISGVTITDLTTTDITTTNINVDNNCKAYKFELGYNLFTKPIYNENNIGYTFVQNYPSTFINNYNTYSCFNHVLIPGNWLLILNYKISQFYNIEYSIYQWGFAYNNPNDFNVFPNSVTHYMDKLIINNYNGNFTCNINVEGVEENIYTNFKIIPNNYTQLSVQAQVKYIRIG